ncbi:MAG: TGBp1 family protein [Firmicutes bacterium]|nr:TGBp1 family protein [Bacillota bacterium]
MDKRIINAVAGAGKTTLIIDECKKQDDSSNIAVIAYTIANQENMRKSIIDEFGCIPSNIYIFGFFEFIYNFCYLPYSSMKNKGICFENPHYKNPNYYSTDGRIFSNKLSKLILIKPSQYLNRIDKYFDSIFIDEIQDLASDDFDWLLSLVNLRISVMGVGDFYQSTFSSSIRGKKNKSLFTDYSAYKSRFTKIGFAFDDNLLVKSYRCNNGVCSFISEKLKINILSHDENSDKESVIFLSLQEDIIRILNDDNIKKLFFQKHYNYKCNSDNWGNSKGCTFSDVCVVLNETTYKFYTKNDLHNLAPGTLAKFYVACSRTKGKLFFIEQKCIPDCYERYDP